MWISSIPLLFLFALAWLAYRRHFVIFFLLLIAPYLCYKIVLCYWYARFVPAQIGISYPVSVGEELALFRDGCAVAIFKVSDQTLENIRQRGLKFLDGATTGRNPINNPHGTRLTQYQAWKETPLPPSWTSEGSWIMCDVADSAVEGKIVEAAKKGGAYYTSATGNDAQLVLAPSLGYVMYSYHH